MEILILKGGFCYCIETSCKSSFPVKSKPIIKTGYMGFRIAI